VLPGVALVTSPVIPSITAASPGIGLNAKVPPKSPLIVTVAPSQVGVGVKEASSTSKTENV
jgi:hypothetical protein